jgi:hypothetical protein
MYFIMRITIVQLSNLSKYISENMYVIHIDAKL